MDLSSFISKVMSKLEEVSPFTEPDAYLAASGDTSYNKVKPLEAYIKNETGGALKDVILMAPFRKLSHVITSARLSVRVVSGVGHSELPADFLRLAEVRLPGWKRSVIYPITSEDPEYVLQQNEFTRGGISKPVAVIRGNGSSGNQRIELYSLPGEEDKDVDCDVFNYIPYWFNECDCDIIPDSISEFVVTLCAARVLRIFNEINQAEMFEKEVSQRLIL